jgi:hypothetical protein
VAPLGAALAIFPIENQKNLLGSMDARKNNENKKRAEPTEQLETTQNCLFLLSTMETDIDDQVNNQ